MEQIFFIVHLFNAWMITNYRRLLLYDDVICEKEIESGDYTAAHQRATQTHNDHCMLLVCV